MMEASKEGEREKEAVRCADACEIGLHGKVESHDHLWSSRVELEGRRIGGWMSPAESQAYSGCVSS